jgi:hypothetical protein
VALGEHRLGEAVQSLRRDSTIFLGGRTRRCEGTEIEAIFVALSVRCGK